MIDPVEQVPFGRTGLNISRLGLGTASITGMFGHEITDADAVQMIHFALDAGVTLFDTAPHYGPLEAETRLGLALEGVPRESYVLETKVGRIIQPDGSRVFDFSYDGIMQSLEGSLKRLKVDAVDSVLLHDPYDFEQQIIDESFPVLAELRSQGVVKAIGVGIADYALLSRLTAHCDFDVYMQAGHYSLLEQGAQPALELYANKRIVVLAAKVFQSGILATGLHPDARYNYGKTPPHIVDAMMKIEAICAEYDVPLRAAALQFVAAHPAVSALVMGARNTSQLSDTLANLQVPVSGEFWSALKDAEVIPHGAPTGIDLET